MMMAGRGARVIRMSFRGWCGGGRRRGDGGWVRLRLLLLLLDRREVGDRGWRGGGLRQQLLGKSCRRGLRT